MFLSMFRHVKTVSVQSVISMTTQPIYTHCQWQKNIHVGILTLQAQSQSLHARINIFYWLFTVFANGVCETFPMKTQEAGEVAQILFSEIIVRYEAMDTLTSDRGSVCTGKLVNALCALFISNGHVPVLFIRKLILWQNAPLVLFLKPSILQSRQINQIGICFCQWPLLQKWFNFNRSLDKYSHAL